MRSWSAPSVSAHRGLAGDASENTLAALILAWARGASAAEIDLSLTRAGHRAVIHDIDLLKVYVWMVDDRGLTRHLAAVGVDGTTKNSPATLRESLIHTMKSLLIDRLPGAAFLRAGGLAALLFVSSCEKHSEPVPGHVSRSGSLRIFAANYPLAYFVQRLGGHDVEVIFDVPRDADPAFWQPTDAQISALQDADLIVMNGATYSKWAEKVTLPESKLVDTSASFGKKFIVVKSTVTHSHGKQGEHSHDGTAFTTWLDFQQAIAQADAICDALKRLKPDSIEHFALNFDDLKKDLLALDTRMVAVGKKLAKQPVVASHPVYQYWARRYGINLEAVLWEPEEVPTDAQMEDLKKILAAHPAKWMVWEGEPAKESVAKIKTLGLDGVVFDPSANTPDKGDFLSVMKENVAAMEQAAGL